MLRLYEPIGHDIFKLHQILEHLVCSVWCEASDDACETKLNEDVKKIHHYIYKPGITFENEIIRIYEIFEGLSPIEKLIVKHAFVRNNEIEKLCNKEVTPIYLSKMHKVVGDDIKPLFKWCYENLLDKAKVAGDKLEYYQELIKKNNFQYCPCCGLIDFESPDPENEVREANDHYLPKSEYPFASVNFQNLVPLCYKCNSDRKKAKDPIENGRKAFYPFANGDHEISITLEIDKTKDIDNLEIADLTVKFIGNQDKIATWDWLFEISERYNDKVRPRIKTFLRELKTRYRQQKKDKPEITFIEIINKEIEVYEDDIYSDWKFLKIPLLKELKKMPELLKVLDV